MLRKVMGMQVAWIQELFKKRERERERKRRCQHLLQTAL